MAINITPISLPSVAGRLPLSKIQEEATSSVHVRPNTATSSFHAQPNTATSSFHAQPNTATSSFHAQPNTATSSFHVQPNTATSSFHVQPNTATSSFHAQPNTATSSFHAQPNTATSSHTHSRNSAESSIANDSSSLSTTSHSSSPSTSSDSIHCSLLTDSSDSLELYSLTGSQDSIELVSLQSDTKPEKSLGSTKSHSESEFELRSLSTSSDEELLPLFCKVITLPNGQKKRISLWNQGKQIALYKKDWKTVAEKTNAIFETIKNLPPKQQDRKFCDPNVEEYEIDFTKKTIQYHTNMQNNIPLGAAATKAVEDQLSSFDQFEKKFSIQKDLINHFPEEEHQKATKLIQHHNKRIEMDSMNVFLDGLRAKMYKECPEKPLFFSTFDAFPKNFHPNTIPLSHPNFPKIGRPEKGVLCIPIKITSKQDKVTFWIGIGIDFEEKVVYSYNPQKRPIRQLPELLENLKKHFFKKEGTIVSNSIAHLENNDYLNDGRYVMEFFHTMSQNNASLKAQFINNALTKKEIFTRCETLANIAKESSHTRHTAQESAVHAIGNSASPGWKPSGREHRSVPSFLKFVKSKLPFRKKEKN